MGHHYLGKAPIDFRLKHKLTQLQGWFLLKACTLMMQSTCCTSVQACDRYRAAWNLKQSSHSALYNWGVALSDMSRVLKTTDRATANGLLTEAAEKYATSLQWNANNPQVNGSVCHAYKSSALPGKKIAHALGELSVSARYCSWLRAL